MSNQRRKDMSLYDVAGLAPAANGEQEPFSLAEVERMYIEMVLETCNGNVIEAAEKLKVAPSTVYRKLLKWENDKS